MMSKLGDFLRAERLKQGLSLGQLARLVGYRNLNKGARRILALERTGTGKVDLVVNVAEALDLQWTTIERLAEEDHRERLLAWEAWVSEPVPMCLVVRLMAAVYSRMALPAWVTTPVEAEAWACEFARQHGCRVCLMLSRRQSVWIDAQGEVEARTEATPGCPNMPFMEVKGRRFLLGLE
jgi:transcriptional regulator with XRE-family HTH domain